MKGLLILADGTRFVGESVGAEGIVSGEAVFNTTMTGYQEVLTDPSYKGQIVTMTCPEIGNYGTNGEDWESQKVFVSGFIVKENCDYPSNWRCGMSLGDYLKNNKVMQGKFMLPKSIHPIVIV